MSLLLAPDIRSWTLSRMTSFSLATFSKGNKVAGVGLPIFWDAPYSYIHASTDIGEVVDWIKDKFLVTKEGNKYLAVPHNRNKMVNAFASITGPTPSIERVLKVDLKPPLKPPLKVLALDLKA